MSLAVKYRPTSFEDLCGQNSISTILRNQIKAGAISNCYIFAGPSGCGKTTIARIFSSLINNNQGDPIEIDAASNNSVDNIRVIVDSVMERALDSKYKVYILDEAHMLSTSSWNALLKTIEEPPEYTIFIFCTTDPQKIPDTIVNRCQVFKLNRIDNSLITDRLKFICDSEHYSYDTSALEQITYMSDGSMRQAISYLDKVKDLSTSITLDSVNSSLGFNSYEVFFNLTNFIIDSDKANIISYLDYLYSQGTDLKLFISNYLSFLLQVTKYIVFNSMDNVLIPSNYEDKLKYTTSITDKEAWFKKLIEGVLNIQRNIKNDSDIKTTITIMLLSLSSD